MSHKCLKQLQAMLCESIARWKIPGASIAVLYDGEIYEAAAGLTHSDQDIPVTSDTLFPYGSVTKTLTATMVLKLVNDGKVDLDAAVANYVPEFDTQQDPVRQTITVRQLLSHSSGLPGTLFQDMGWGPTALQENVELINQHPQFFKPGEMLSYCNSGLLLLGRIVECVTGENWHQAFQTLLAQPLGISSMVTKPEDALRFRFSPGHVRSPAAPAWQVAPYPFAFASHSPAGSTPSGRAWDLLTVVKMYLRFENSDYLSDEIIRDAWTVQQPSCVSQLLKGWGLGWTVLDWETGTVASKELSNREHSNKENSNKEHTKVVAHDGATMGTNSFLRVHPESGTAIALLVNATNGGLVYDDLFSVLSQNLINAWEPGVPDSEPEPPDALSQYEGVYRDVNGCVKLERVNDVLELSTVAEDGNHLPGSFGGKTVLTSSGNGNFYTLGEVSKALTNYPGEITNLVAPYTVLTTDNGDTYFHNGYLGFRKI